MKRNIKKHFIAYRLLRPIIHICARILLNFKCKPAPEIKEPCIILANHTMDWDPLLVACSFKKPINFLASEHAMRMGFLSFILKTFFSPIERVKGSTDAAAAMSLVSMIRNGVSVCMFPEGNRSFDGKTDKLHPTTSRLAKLCNCTIVTYKIKGGYLTTPRWGCGLRRGKVTGEVVNVYTADDVKKMSTEELSSHISEDISENIYETQHTVQQKYSGRNLAEGIERVLYICPKCHKIGTIKGIGNYGKCECGLSFRYNVFGILEGMEEPFNTICGWNEWQKSFLKDLLAKDAVNIYDEDQKLYTLEKDHTLKLVDSGRLSISNTELLFNDKKFPLDKIQLSVIRKQDIVFSYEGVNYEIHSGHARSALKYLTMSDIVKYALKTN